LKKTIISLSLTAADIEGPLGPVCRWRQAMPDGLTAARSAKAVGNSGATLYRWKKQLELRSRRMVRLLVADSKVRNGLRAAIVVAGGQW